MAAALWAALLTALLTVSTLAGCAASSPLVQLYHLRSAAPVASAAPVPSTMNWQLLQPVRVPEYLDRDALLLPQGQSGLLALPGHRWAEPLRDSVPRVLRQDLATLLGEARVWSAPVPAGVSIGRQVRVELLALEASADRSSVNLRARWSVIDPGGAGSARADAVTLSIPSTGTDVDSLVAAHRLALWRLAERIAASP
jgi:uncharacterized protein